MQAIHVQTDNHRRISVKLQTDTVTPAKCHATHRSLQQSGLIQFRATQLNQRGRLFKQSREAVEEAASIRLRTNYTPAVSETALFGFASVQPVKISLDGNLVLDAKLTPETEDVFTALMDPPFTSSSIDFVSGKPVSLDIAINLANREGLALAAQNFVFGFETDRSNEQALIAEAVEAAKAAELAIVVVGTNAQVESEGFDRKDLKLPGRQDELVSAVVAANPNTIVIVNSGSPVLMPWRKEVKAVLVSYFGGEQMGNALVDMLTGATEPGGRLPTTWPATEASVPVLNCTPDANHQIIYEDGIHIGYRAWLKAGAKPAYDFGYGQIGRASCRERVSSPV